MCTLSVRMDDKVMNQVKPKDPDRLLEMGGILGKPKKGFSWEELREEATFETYGI